VYVLKIPERTAAVILAAGIILCGCNGVDQAEGVESAQARLEQFYASAALVENRADTFAANLCIITGTADAADSQISAEAAGVFGIDNQQVVYQKHPFERMYPASVSKILTALVAIKYGNLQASVTVGQEAVIAEAGASLCNIKPGDTLTLEQLLYGLMLPSGNDAGAAIAVYMEGSIGGFSDLMNQEARALGATDSHFVNPHGLHDENHYTTPYDLYLIFNEALKYPEFRTVIGTLAYTAEYMDGDGNPKTQTWKNSNQYLSGEQDPPQGQLILGGKTGTTQAAGSCLIIVSENEHQEEYISVILKASDRARLYEDMTNIISKIVN